MIKARALQLWRRSIAAVLGLVLFAALQVAPASAQTPPAAAPSQTSPTQSAPPRGFLPPRAAPAAEAPAPPSGMMANLYAWMAQQQRAFTQTMAKSLRDIKTGDAFMASLALIGFSFAYGVLHAAGPGHGKAIVSSYILADRQTVRRGIYLAFLSSFIQALSAIALFAIVVLALAGARTQVLNTETLLERASWLIVALFGAWLLFRQIRAMITGRSAHDHAHDHGHAHHDHKHAHHGHAHDHKHDHAPATAHHGHAHHDHKAHQHHDHHAQGHSHAHGAADACETCGHSHMPTPAQMAGEWSWTRALTLAFAVGIRPCTGAVGVLFVANGLGLMWAGVVSTFAMAIGTALTVSGLAALTVSSRDLAAKLAGTADNSWGARAQQAFGLIGAALVFLLGSSFFYYSLISPQAL